MPVRNVEPYVETCLNSILEQTYLNWELIAVNDHSSDASGAILRRYEQGDERITILENEGRGIVEALKLAYSRSTGDLIHRMDSDDIMPVDKLEKMILQWEPGAVVTGKVEYFSDEWMVGLGFQNYERWINDLMESSDFWADVYMECPIPSPAWLMSRSDFDAIGGFDSDHMPEDYDLCFRAYEHKLKVNTVKEVVHRWRDSQNRTSRKEPIYFPMAYYPLKVHYFLRIDRDPVKELVLWGAGKKGKLVAQLLRERSVDFRWVTDNERKWGLHIGGTLVSAPEDLNDVQMIVAVSSPDDKAAIAARLAELDSKKGMQHWWFC